MSGPLASFFVEGHPAPGGSKRHIGHGILIDAGKGNREWKNHVKQVAREYHGDKPPFDGPLVLSLVFFVARPAGHYLDGDRSRGLSKKGRETPFPITKPDSTKLLRAVEDALNKVLYHDDAQNSVTSDKVYGVPEGVMVVLTARQQHGAIK